MYCPTEKTALIHFPLFPSALVCASQSSSRALHQRYQLSVDGLRELKVNPVPIHIEPLCLEGSGR